MAMRVAWKQIKDCKYSITVMDCDRALRGFGVLTKYLAGPLGALLAMKDLNSIDPSTAASAVGQIGMMLGTDDFREMAYMMLDEATVQFTGGKTAPLVTLIRGSDRSTLNAHFAGDIGAFAALVWFALMENYGNFLDAFPGMAGLLKRAQANVVSLTHPQTTIGA